MKTICIIPTHRNRYNFLEKTIGVIKKDKNIYKIIIINNGSTIESTSKINKLKSQKIKIINFKINVGSNAHIHGIKMALKFKSNKFIWVLDDDNLPKKNTLKFLIKKFSKFKNTNHAFTPIRYELNQYKKYLLGKHNFNYYNNNIIVYNGEIYNFLEIKDDLKKLNYTFDSNSDTEVILKAYDKWGIDCIKKFIGMFVIIIYDKKKEKVILVGRKLLHKHIFLKNV